ncbi:MAG: zinc ribbon domain-containing protein [Lachnospiraceae bacterium]|nr:zinc ribbon domain-containing protein [Lachnospiraceae bacterium]
MKRLVKALVLLALTTLICFSMTACADGSVVNTKLTVNADLSGSRVMDVVISESVFNQNFSGSIDDLYNLVSANCPAELKFTHPADGTMELVFTLDFTDPADYNTKISSLYEGASSAIVVPDSVWGTGFSVDENVGSLELLAWLENLLVDEGYVPESNRNRIFSMGTNELIFNGENFSTGSLISVDRLDYVSIFGIDVLTGVNSLDSFDRSYVFSIDANSASSKEADIEEFFKAFEATGATVTNTTEDGKIIYTVSKSGLDANGLAAFGTEVFGGDTVTIEKMAEDDLSLFSFGNELKEAADYSSFIISTNGLEVNAYVSIPDGIKIGQNAGYYFGRDEVTPSENYPGYFHWDFNYFYSYTEPMERSYFIVKTYSLSDIATKTKVKGKDSFEEEVAFNFGEVPADAEKTAIEDRMRLKFAAEENSISVEGVMSEDGKYSVKTAFAGNVDEMKTRLEAVTGRSATFTYAEHYRTMALKYGKALSEKFSFGDFADDDINVTHELDMGAFTKITSCTDELAQLKGGKAELVGVNKVDSDVLAESFNVFGIAIYVCLVLAVLFILLAVVKSGIIKEVKEKIAAGKAAKAAAVAAQPVNVAPAAPVQEKPAFCEKCGAPRDADAAVCVQCGFKFED